jgi:predicted PurR-regulated permease PerM
MSDNMESAGLSRQQWLTLARYGLIALAISGIVLLLISAGSALVPFVIGAALAYLVNPIVNRLNARMPRWAAILVVYLIGLAVLIAIVVLIVPPLVNQIESLVLNLANPAWIEQLVRDLNAVYRNTVPPQLQSPIESTVQGLIPTVQANLSNILQSVARFALSQIASVIGLVSFLFGLLVVPIWVFFVLNSTRQAGVSLNRLLNYRVRPDFWNAWGLIDRSMSAFIRGQLTLGAIVGVAVWIGLIVLDVIPGIEIDYILLLAIWAGIAELVPMVGALLGGLPAVIVTFFVGGPISALAVLGLFVVVQLVENYFLVPRVIGTSVGVHPAILLVALVVFGSVFGFIGVILAAPITAILRDLYVYAYQRLSGRTPREAIESPALTARLGAVKRRHATYASSQASASSSVEATNIRPPR